MKILKKINLVLVILLSISAGIAKVTLSPQGVEFIQWIGLSETLVFVFGIAQIIFGLLIISKKLRKLGAILASVMFSLSTIIVFVNEQYVIGAFSILPIILTGFIIRESEKNT
jgi:uncharacterized membrane protein YphA (DoxX/SURF4 family)